MGIVTWFAHSFHKTRLDENKKGIDKYQIYTAKNQYNSCQLIMKPDSDYSNVEISCDKLVHNDGNSLEVELFKVCYVDCLSKGIWPDPIPPLDKEIDLKADCVQPVLLRVYVSKSASSGTYAGNVNIKVNEKVIRKLELSVHIWNFSLPDRPACQTAFGIAKSGLSAVYGIGENSKECADLYKKYYDELLKYRISAYDLPVDILSDEADVYLNDERMTSFVIPYSEEDEKLKRYLDKVRSNRSWFQKGMFYPLDEPKTEEDYEKLDAIHKRLESLEPNYRIVLPFYVNQRSGKAKDACGLMLCKVNIWCPESCLFDNINYWDKDREPDGTLGEKLDIRRNKGETIWWYVCCGPSEPYCNLFISMQGLNHRLLFWQQWMNNIEGLLYWCTNWWSEKDGTTDPWTDMATVKSINNSLYGDGSLFYPGKKVGLDGPVSSLRLEAVRDGIYDYEYLTIAEKTLGREYTLKICAEIITSLTEYTSDEDLFMSVRKKLAERIESMCF